MLESWRRREQVLIQGWDLEIIERSDKEAKNKDTVWESRFITGGQKVTRPKPYRKVTFCRCSFYLTRSGARFLLVLIATVLLVIEAAVIFEIERD